jgi:hypothetical protein
MLLKKPITVAITLFSSLLTESVDAAAIDLEAHATPNTPNLVERKMGINCKGSSNCWGETAILELCSSILEIPDNHTFYEGEHIACAAGGICTFLQRTGTNGVSGLDIKKLFDFLVGHGCKGCGSVPTAALQGINDIQTGELTVNYVSHRHCDGLCDIDAPSG